jgi:hypothetical protein
LLQLKSVGKTLEQFGVANLDEFLAQDGVNIWVVKGMHQQDGNPYVSGGHVTVGWNYKLWHLNFSFFSNAVVCDGGIEGPLPSKVDGDGFTMVKKKKK